MALLNTMSLKFSFINLFVYFNTVTLTTSGTKVCSWNGVSPTIWAKHLGTHVGFNPNSLCAHKKCPGPMDTTPFSGFGFAVSNSFWCEQFVFDVSNLFLMWAICFWCKQFVFDVSNLFLMWAICFWCDSCGPPYLIHLQLFIYLNILNPLSWTQQYFSINIFFCSWEWL